MERTKKGGEKMLNRVTVLYGEDSYFSIPAEEFHEDGEFLKVYNSSQEMVAMIKTSLVNVAYMSEEKKNG